ncbi:MAG: hypothetical protein JJU05_13895 [Verrucomicrobia bacterium]|nr:hypothetical protein [Verrucomicrobiota bacterium]MCH8527991.1 hypothetical protein [Kiritimatiellia bacterium]
MKTFTRSLRRWNLLVCLVSFGAFAGEDLLPPDVRESIARQHAVRLEVVYRDYQEALEARFRAAEAAGDIDLMVEIADERDAPGEGETPEDLLVERDALQAGLVRVERTRNERILAELKRLRDSDEGHADVEEAAAALEAELAEPPLGPSLLPEDFFSPEQNAEWRMRLPYGQRENRSGPAAEEGETFFRIHQEPGHFLVISRELVLLEGVDYHLSWEARGVRPDTLAEEEGEPAVYAVGFGISDARYRTLVSGANARVNRTVWQMAPAPVDSEWVEQRGVLRTGPHMDQLMFRTSTGTGEWQLRNLQIRRVY